jgi:hypothetical protein
MAWGKQYREYTYSAKDSLIQNEWNSMIHGLINVKNFWIKGSRLNRSDYKVHSKVRQKIWKCKK